MKIIVDFQESRNHVFKYFTINTEVKKLKVGDFIISKDICVERKTVEDFVNSIISLILLTQNYSRPDGSFYKDIVILRLCIFMEEK